jgi:uncharacterized RDD family membrane protein YckC
MADPPGRDEETAPAGMPPYPGTPQPGSAPGSPPGGGGTPAYYPGPPGGSAPPSYPGPPGGGWTQPPYPGPGYPPGGATQQPPGAATPGAAAPFANYGKRLGGWLLDWLILLVVNIILGAILNNVHVARFTFHVYNSRTHVTTYEHLSFLNIAVNVLVVILYGGLMCGSQRGQTLGMMAAKTRAVDAQTGGPIGPGRGVWRGAFEYLCFIFIVIPWLVDMLFPLWDSKNQTLHDKVSNTVVVLASPPGTTLSR